MRTTRNSNSRTESEYFSFAELPNQQLETARRNLHVWYSATAAVGKTLKILLNLVYNKFISWKTETQQNETRRRLKDATLRSLAASAEWRDVVVDVGQGEGSRADEDELCSEKRVEKASQPQVHKST